MQSYIDFGVCHIAFVLLASAWGWSAARAEAMGIRIVQHALISIVSCDHEFGLTHPYMVRERERKKV